jgi:nitronate monooxygenase
MFSFSQLTLPVIQAPMAGGINTPQLASAVANAGGVGSFGFAYSSPEKINDDLLATQALTSGFINANFFIFNPVELPEQDIQLKAIDTLKSLPINGEFSVSIPQSPFFPDLNEQLAPVWINRPAILTFHFGIPPLEIIEKAHSLGISVGITATSLKEGIAIQNSGADFIVSQGVEAGGHRGIFVPDTEDELLSTIVLTKQLADNCSIPIAAAGGLMSGQDIKNALAAGAAAAQLGTAFLCCDEAGTSSSHRDFLLNKHDRGSVFTKGFSGRLARGIDNEFIKLMANKPGLPFPIQNTLTAPLRQLAGRTNNGEYQSLWAGEGYARTRQMSTSELIEKLRCELSALNIKITHPDS